MSSTFTIEQQALLSLDEASSALRLALLAHSAVDMANSSDTGFISTTEKSDRQKEKKDAKDSRKNAAALKEQRPQVSLRPVATTKDLDCDIDVGTSFDVEQLFGSSDLPYDGSFERERFYLTTAINYTNGNPHIGHAYEAITSDFISRYHRLNGRNVFFLTGTDEHGQKIAAAAEAEGKEPIDICNFYAGHFQELNRRLLISNNYYVRTTDEAHHAESKKLWMRCAEAGDIYLGKYEGWYDEREETFVSDKDAELTDFKDAYGSALKRTSEASYFFRLSKYQDWLIKYINENPAFIQPPDKRTFILARLSEPLVDLSISRTTFRWGIPVPETFDQSHVMYVWFDALSNYISAIYALDKSHELSGFWPADCHVIGKDITWFHCVIWPCMLKSAELALPKAVFAHGFIAGADGRKMSKSLKNVVDPHDLCSSFPVDSIRWYLCRECPFGSDLAFSRESLVNVHNADLCDTLGNLVHRVLSLNQKYSNGAVPPPLIGGSYEPFNLMTLRNQVTEFMKEFAMQQALQAVMAATRDTNKFLTDEAPWHIKGTDSEAVAKRQEIVRVALDAVYCLAHFLAPALPAGATSIFNKCGAKPVPIPTLRPDFVNLPPGSTTSVGNILFKKLEAPTSDLFTDSVPETSAILPKAESSKVKSSKVESKDNSKKAVTTNIDETDGQQDDFTKMDIRVGKITKVWHHPESEKLFCEEIDIGEASTREVASGLRAHLTLNDLENQLICVVCNLKPAKLAGFVSNGMVLAGSGPNGKVELIRPPVGSVVGERLSVEGLSGEPLNANQIKKKKVWESLVPLLRINSDGYACFGPEPIRTSSGVCFVDTLREGSIS